MRLHEVCYQTHPESAFKHKGGDGEEGRLSPSEASCHSAGISRWHLLLEHKDVMEDSLLEPRPTRS